MKIYILINFIAFLLFFLYIVYVACTAFDRVLSRNNNLYIKKSKFGGKYGRGVFTASDIKESDIIEIVPYIEDTKSNFIGEIRNYMYNKEGYVNPLLSDIGVIPFGYACLYNHMDEPNAIWFIEGKYFFIKAVKPIKKDEEIFISYGPRYWLARKINKV